MGNENEIRPNMKYGHYKASVNALKKGYRQKYSPNKTHLSEVYEEYKFFKNGKLVAVAQKGLEDSYCNPEIKYYTMIQKGEYLYSSTLHEDGLHHKEGSENKFDRIDTKTQYAIDGANGCPRDGIVQEGEIFSKKGSTVFSPSLIDSKEK